ncbi:1-deoxy-D-xylulose-5-phosphate reductoisomerase [Neptunicella marina]|uniref:1-deoxy-D-xylulose 5-phosphate reductoisomerase n=1 Tax=Neptunicella marina TaxID=2125989 RepID=A0A8J6M0I8_9ALTE|nr:1-deoxy-D-xylulose-5-phosphate reductoisomerase [Neptunicella marina]MBC3764887.1 1-deoxy-D-xylulose-5-phosphate reductoisomerase [Neptunicella marina]
MQTISILGATGSIGQSTLDVVNRHPDLYRVFGLTCHSQVELLIEQARLCQPHYLVVTDPNKLALASDLAKQAGLTAQVLDANSGLKLITQADDVSVVMAAIVGAAGLLPTLYAVQAGKKVLLANKESLVMSGELFMSEVNKHRATLLPIDSEHNAIFQCLPADYQYANPKQSGISKILLTGSGGPFLNEPIDTLINKSPDQACAHPNWQMGRKISVDSATMMNKGLEFIEACWLFGLQPENIEIVLHPQSVIHSMVQYKDGSVIAQLGNPDMRTPIAHALAYPERIDAGVAPLDFSQLTDFSFCKPDFNRYPNLRLAINAVSAGQYASTALNAANEVAVDAFLRGRIAFTQIADINRSVLEHTASEALNSIEDVINFDQRVRKQTQQHLTKVA